MERLIAPFFQCIIAVCVIVKGSKYCCTDMLKYKLSAEYLCNISCFWFMPLNLLFYPMLGNRNASL